MTQIPPFRRRWPVDPFDLAALLAFVLMSVWVLITLMSKSGPNRIWTGTDGPFVGDKCSISGGSRVLPATYWSETPFKR